MNTQKQQNQRNLVGALGGGIAIAADNSMPGFQHADGQPPIPEEGMPSHNFAMDVESFCKSGKCEMVGQDESDPSFVVFKQGDSKFKLPQAMFISGFRGSNKAEE